MFKLKYYWHLILIFLALEVVGGQDYSPQKVVYHINYGEMSRINATFNNITNHLDALGEDAIDLKVVVHGGALEYFIESKNDVDKQMALDSLRFQNVQFLICGNTLLAYQVKRQDLYEGCRRGHGTSWITNHRRFAASRVYLCTTITKRFKSK
tara:strand:- start:1963 stop:2421 length:459 start_codon:yes stop_codon:yes gene_type:complete